MTIALSMMSTHPEAQSKGALDCGPWSLPSFGGSTQMVMSSLGTSCSFRAMPNYRGEGSRTYIQDGGGGRDDASRKGECKGL